MSLTIIVVVVLAIVISIVVTLAVLATGVTLIFTDFVMKLSPLLSIVMFIVFPPALIIFLVGYAMIYFGFVERMYGVTKRDLE